LAEDGDAAPESMTGDIRKTGDEEGDAGDVIPYIPRLQTQVCGEVV